MDNGHFEDDDFSVEQVVGETHLKRGVVKLFSLELDGEEGPAPDIKASKVE